MNLVLQSLKNLKHSMVIFLFHCIAINIAYSQCSPPPTIIPLNQNLGLAPGSCLANVPKPASLPTRPPYSMGDTAVTTFSDGGSLYLDGSILGFGYQYLGSVRAPIAPAGNTLAPGRYQVNCGPVTFKATPLYADGTDRKSVV